MSSVPCTGPKAGSPRSAFAFALWRVAFFAEILANSSKRHASRGSFRAYSTEQLTSQCGGRVMKCQFLLSGAIVVSLTFAGGRPSLAHGGHGGHGGGHAHVSHHSGGGHHSAGSHHSSGGSHPTPHHSSPHPSTPQHSGHPSTQHHSQAPHSDSQHSHAQSHHSGAHHPELHHGDSHHPGSQHVAPNYAGPHSGGTGTHTNPQYAGRTNANGTHYAAYHHYAHDWHTWHHYGWAGHYWGSDDGDGWSNSAVAGPWYDPYWVGGSASVEMPVAEASIPAESFGDEDFATPAGASGTAARSIPSSPVRPNSGP